MISHKKITELVNNYDHNKITIAVLGGHSGLDVCSGAKQYGFKTLAVCQKGREKTYANYYKTHDSKGCVDEIILVDKFSDITKPGIQEKLRKLNVIFIHNRYFWVYFPDFNQIENEFLVPIFGNRIGVKLEERDQPNNQYTLLEKAEIRLPKIFKRPEEIDRLVLVKASEAERSYERAFFTVTNFDEYKKISEERIAKGISTKEGIGKAVIEEFIIGAQINLNFFYSPLTKELELMGTDMRRQTNLDGLLRIPAWTLMENSEYFKRNQKMIETGHVAVTMKESLLEKAYELGEKFVQVMQKEVPPGMIGPFALQGAVVAEQSKEEFVIFDVSMRIPGSPGTKFTPYSGYLYGESLSYGERIAMEIKHGIQQGKLNQLLT